MRSAVSPIHVVEKVDVAVLVHAAFSWMLGKRGCAGARCIQLGCWESVFSCALKLPHAMFPTGSGDRCLLLCGGFASPEDRREISSVPQDLVFVCLIKQRPALPFQLCDWRWHPRKAERQIHLVKQQGGLRRANSLSNQVT
mmetsp:Transcript_33264/g.66637  ORF Transcript_33264/g.66637 Transcript_33264/m.66637 type:complete len:141 (-) Transcript_33264:78-500(-)